MQKIGILGGTFDPIHFGHLRMAVELSEQMDLKKVHIIPCFQPVHRNFPSATARQRMEMVEIAVSKEPKLVADPREIQRESPSYTIDTLLELRREYPETVLCLLLGIDAFLGFTTWHRYLEILDLAHIIIANRPRFKLPNTGELAEIIEKKLVTEKKIINQHVAGGLFFQHITDLEISATDIRKQVAMGGNPRYLLPDEIYDYIKQHGIYNS